MGTKFGDAYFEERRRERQARQPRKPKRERRERKLGQFAKEQTYQFGNGVAGTTDTHTAPVHGMTEDGQPVTVAFGIGKHEGETYLKDGHASGYDDFWEKDGVKQHDHYGKGRGTQRGMHTGRGA